MDIGRLINFPISIVINNHLLQCSTVGVFKLNTKTRRHKLKLCKIHYRHFQPKRMPVLLKIELN